MRSGYCYELNISGQKNKKDWRSSSDELWETVVYTATGEEKLVGGRYIDGYQVRVYLCPDGLYRAQLP